MIARIAALALGATLIAAPAFAEQVVQTKNHMIKAHGRMIMVHAMKMDDGSVIYGMSQRDLERLLNMRTRQFSESFGH